MNQQIRNNIIAVIVFNSKCALRNLKTKNKTFIEIVLTIKLIEIFFDLLISFICMLCK